MISPEPVLTPEIFDLARAVADRYAGTLADVLRLAIPPRHATAEREAREVFPATLIARDGMEIDVPFEQANAEAPD